MLSKEFNLNLPVSRIDDETFVHPFHTARVKLVNTLFILCAFALDVFSVIPNIKSGVWLSCQFLYVPRLFQCFYRSIIACFNLKSYFHLPVHTKTDERTPCFNKNLRITTSSAHRIQHISSSLNSARNNLMLFMYIMSFIYVSLRAGKLNLLWQHKNEQHISQLYKLVLCT